MVVVLPTPPFWLATAMIRGRACPAWSRRSRRLGNDRRRWVREISGRRSRPGRPVDLDASLLRHLDRPRGRRRCRHVRSGVGVRARPGHLAARRVVRCVPQPDGGRCLRGRRLGDGIRLERRRSFVVLGPGEHAVGREIDLARRSALVRLSQSLEDAVAAGVGVGHCPMLLGADPNGQGPSPATFHVKHLASSRSGRFTWNIRWLRRAAGDPGRPRGAESWDRGSRRDASAAARPPSAPAPAEARGAVASAIETHRTREARSRPTPRRCGGSRRRTPPSQPGARMSERSPGRTALAAAPRARSSARPCTTRTRSPQPSAATVSSISWTRRRAASTRTHLDSGQRPARASPGIPAPDPRSSASPGTSSRSGPSASASRRWTRGSPGPTTDRSWATAQARTSTSCQARIDVGCTHGQGAGGRIRSWPTCRRSGLPGSTSRSAFASMSASQY